jgi:hypothetical protein
MGTKIGLPLNTWISLLITIPPSGVHRVRQILGRPGQQSLRGVKMGSKMKTLK